VRFREPTYVRAFQKGEGDGHGSGIASRNTRYHSAPRAITPMSLRRTLSSFQAGTRVRFMRQ
jgi:hypothetical protein